MCTQEIELSLGKVFSFCFGLSTQPTFIHRVCRLLWLSVRNREAHG